MEKDKKSVLIVGAGFSGLSIAIHLLRKKVDVTLVDNGVNFSSIIAAGMINPLVFRRMTKSWNVDVFMPFLIDFYRQLEAETGHSFYHPITIRRMFSTQQERELWLDKENLPAFQNYMNTVSEADDNFSDAINKFGSGRVKQSSFIDTAAFLRETRLLVEKQGTVLNETFEYKKLIESSYKGQKYDNIIFCEGYLGVHNPWFGDLPLDQTKGETVTISSKDIPEDVSLNRKCFVLPLGNNTFKVGSTYVWNTPDTSPTKEGKTTILDNLSYLTNADYSVIDQGAGVRPTTKDRRPLIGTHPKHKNYHFFNGLGAKGYLIGPYLSSMFVGYLIDGKEIDSEVDIKRVYKKRAK